ncbi:MAG: metallophosphoesterase [Desulfobacterales bacterium]|nr:metallophosphoesterase [Desulfobacterales bacterium]
MRTNHLNNIGIIGDIHGESLFLEAALNFFIDFELELIVSVGDIIDGKGDIDRCCELLNNHSVVTIRGNHERWFLDKSMRCLSNATQPESINKHAYDFIANLPITKEFNTIKGQLLLCHGIDKHDMIKVTPDDFGYGIDSNFELQELIKSNRFRFVINGHTHRRMVRSFGNLTIINAGTIKHEENPCIAIVDFKDEIVNFYDIQADLSFVESQRFSLR